MFEIIVTLYLVIVAVLLLSDVAKGLLDVVLKQPALSQAAELIRRWYSELLKEEAIRATARRVNVSYGKCNWDRCDSLSSGAGKAIAMK